MQNKVLLHLNENKAIYRVITMITIFITTLLYLLVINCGSSFYCKSVPNEQIFPYLLSIKFIFSILIGYSTIYVVFLSLLRKRILLSSVVEIIDLVKFPAKILCFTVVNVSLIILGLLNIFIIKYTPYNYIYVYAYISLLYMFFISILIELAIYLFCIIYNYKLVALLETGVGGNNLVLIGSSRTICEILEKSLFDSKYRNVESKDIYNYFDVLLSYVIYSESKQCCDVDKNIEKCLDIVIENIEDSIVYDKSKLVHFKNDFLIISLLLDKYLNMNRQDNCDKRSFTQYMKNLLLSRSSVFQYAFFDVVHYSEIIEEIGNKIIVRDEFNTYEILNSTFIYQYLRVLCEKYRHQEWFHFESDIFNMWRYTVAKTEEILTFYKIMLRCSLINTWDDLYLKCITGVHRELDSITQLDSDMLLNIISISSLLNGYVKNEYFPTGSVLTEDFINDEIRTLDSAIVDISKYNCDYSLGEFLCVVEKINYIYRENMVDTMFIFNNSGHSSKSTSNENVIVEVSNSLLDNFTKNKLQQHYLDEDYIFIDSLCTNSYINYFRTESIEKLIMKIIEFNDNSDLLEKATYDEVVTYSFTPKFVEKFPNISNYCRRSTNGVLKSYCNKAYVGTETIEDKIEKLYKTEDGDIFLEYLREVDSEISSKVTHKKSFDSIRIFSDDMSSSLPLYEYIKALIICGERFRDLEVLDFCKDYIRYYDYEEAILQLVVTDKDGKLEGYILDHLTFNVKRILKLLYNNEKHFSHCDLEKMINFVCRYTNGIIEYDDTKYISLLSKVEVSNCSFILEYSEKNSDLVTLTYRKYTTKSIEFLLKSIRHWDEYERKLIPYCLSENTSKKINSEIVRLCTNSYDTSDKFIFTNAGFEHFKRVVEKGKIDEKVLIDFVEVVMYDKYTNQIRDMIKNYKKNKEANNGK